MGDVVWTAEFRRMWASTALANLADGVLLAGLPVLATTVTTSPSLVAGVDVAYMGSMALTALPAGVLADHGDRASMVRRANVVRVLGLVTVLGVVAAAGWVLAGIYAAAVLVGSSETLADAAAQTAVPSLVSEGELGRAHGRLIGTQVALNNGIGAPLGGVLAVAGITWLLTIPAVLYGLGAAVIMRLRLRAATSATAPMVTDIRHGVAYVWDRPALRRIALANSAINLGNTAFGALSVLLFIGPLSLPRAAFGGFLALLAAGGIVGSVLNEQVVRRIGHRAVLLAGPVTVGAAYGAICLTVDPWVGGVASLLLGLAGMLWNVTSRVVRQRLTPDRLLGRITTTMQLTSLAATPVGGLLGGLVAEVAGLRSVGYVAVGAAVVAWMQMRRIDADALRPLADATETIGA